MRAARRDRDRQSGRPRRLCIGVALLIVWGGISGAGDIDATPMAPTPRIQSDSLQVGEVQRTYLYHVPKKLSAPPELVVVFHGGGIDAEKMREITAYEFERLADEHGFIVVYPNGVDKGWNGCRKNAPYPANLRNIDDPAFVRALIRHFRAEFGVDSARVFGIGFSNGAHLAYRLALEMPDEIAAIAAVGANLPAEDHCDCFYSEQPMAVMIVNGTADRINPYDGGEVTLPDGTNLGIVLSAQATADYFRRLAGHARQPAVYRYPDSDSSDGCTVERLTWEREGLPEITLLTIFGGGHTIPQPRFRFPEIYGATNRDISAAAEIWRFFDNAKAERAYAGGGSHSTPN